MPDTTAPRGSLLPPVFSTIVTNAYGLGDVGDRASPSLADIDGDGDLDAFIGGADGNTRVYLNTGSATSPAFGAAVAGSYGLGDVGTNAIPSLADIDGDGDLDAFIGDRDGNTQIYANTGSAGNPAFVLSGTNLYGLGNVGYDASPSFADIDGDGDLDAFIGNFFGNTLVFLNTGSVSNPDFVLSGTNYGLGNVGLRASPRLADIDGDGDLDAFIGNDAGNTQVYLNTGSASSPAFVLADANLYGLPDVGNTASLSLADIDGDGDLDAFIGNYAGNTQVYLNTPSSFVAPVTSSAADGSYGIGSVITLMVEFSENVFVDISGGTPTLTLETGATDRLATYSSGSGTSTLSFTYTVQAGDTSADLDFISASALALNGATLQDAVGNDAVLTLAMPGTPGSLAANAALVIDTAAPTATLAATSLNNTASASVQSTETGTAYLVSTSLAVSSLASITGALDASWNAVVITTANTDTALSAAGLGEGAYQLYTADAAGNLSAASTGSVTIDSTAPTATLAAATITDTSTGSATVQSTEIGTAYLVNTSIAVSNLASITGAADASWNTVAITAVNTDTVLPATGLSDSSYQLYTVDAAGNLSAVSADLVAIDGNAPHGTLAGTPVFSAPVTNAYGLSDEGSYANTSLVDIDSDGDLDALIGARFGNTLVYLNTGSASGPAFAAPVTNPYGLGDVGLRASPRVADIDGDGDLDAFIGNDAGNTQVYLNTGSASSPAFAAFSTNPWGLTDVGFHASPSLADIDGDGDLDALIGERLGNSLVYLNTGSASSPAFAAPSTSPYGLTDVGGSASPSFADIDGDGDLDAFIGDRYGNTQVFLNIGSFVGAPVTSSTANGSYGVGSVITLKVAFSENVIVDTSGGTPTLALETGATDRAVSYSSGSGSKTLIFIYTVQAGDTSADLDFISSSALALNGATIQDAAGNNAILTLATPGATGSLAANKALVIDGIAPIATLTAATIANTSSVTVQSTEAGTAYLVSTLVTVTDLASITGAADASWNAVAITAANTNTALAATGLSDGSYKLYTRDAVGNLSAASTGSVTIDSTAPTATLTAASLASTGSATVQSTEAGTAYLVNTSIAVSNLAGITGAVDASWNAVAITTANTNTALAATGLSDGTYKLYTTDALGNFSAASADLVTIDSTAPHGTLAGTPVFSAPVANAYGLSDAGDDASPSLADIDGDGDLDAFVGDYDGAMRVYLNTGSVSSPAFAAPAANPYGLTDVGDYANPSLADIDGDGDLDAFVGGLDGNTRVYLNTGSTSNPAFAAPVSNRYGLTDVGLNASPSFADIDGDGDLDAFIGNAAGNTLVYLNTGNATSPAFAAPITTPYGLGDVGNFANPSLADVDGDGDLDAFMGNSDGNTLVFLNTGSASSPAFAVPVTNPYGLSDVGSFSRPSLADIDGDGDLDAFVGEGSGSTQVFLNTGTFGFVAPVTSSTANGSYGIGSVITLKVTFSETVLVAGGTPMLALETGSTDRLASYSSGSGTSTLRFTYTVQAGDSAVDLDFTSSSALALNGATIRDTAGNDAVLTLAAPGAAGSLAANAALEIDWTRDALVGTAGADTLNGGLGADTMSGGDGSDRYYVDHVGDGVVETNAVTASGGTDTVYSSLAAYTLTSNVERGVIQSSGAASLTGNALANRLYAGSGNNVLDGAGGTDQVSYVFAASAVTVSLAASGAQNTGGSGWDTLVSIDNLIGSSYGDTLTGNAGANALESGAGNDTLEGGAGADTLNGGLGADTMSGGDGSDRYYVDHTSDVVSETNAAATGGTDTVYSTLSAYTLTRNVEYGILQASGAANLTGNALANRLYAGSGDNVLDGAGGTDRVLYGLAGAGVTVSLAASGAQNTGGSGWDTLVSIEQLIGSDYADSLTGNSGGNVLGGGAGNDTLEGGAGNDILTGSTGADRFLFGSASGQDGISDFSISQGDQISLLTNLNGSGIVDGASALSHLSDVSGNAVLDLGGGHTVTLTGVLTADLQAGDFLFY
jgi:hypothetical protein